MQKHRREGKCKNSHLLIQNSKKARKNKGNIKIHIFQRKNAEKSWKRKNSHLLIQNSKKARKKPGKYKNSPLLIQNSQKKSEI